MTGWWMPRLLCFYGEGEPLPDLALAQARTRSTGTTGRAWASRCARRACACTGRSGRSPGRIDTGRGATQDTQVATVRSAPCALALRPRRGGPAIRYDLGHGDLLVMGGSCQRTWEHAVPKTTRATGPRISVQFRPRGVR
jgi:hypothetical protein